ncbi:proliferation marker protein Ki-67 [Brienomyrus brachyistius]|uniref:proliferation marker protein Ki-67 n=1 Tax=Brienomyrus brachyistius TaxID=42636 RepID=UPI0020B1FB0E|nr:proliferation marker protein Ki-67 [Brienomyrus brachyistius]XP_048842964.1 proliferation marker protein Ki-67 [Brienomyrus brachyistius]
MPLHGKIVVIKRSGGDGTEFPLTAACLFGRKPECDIRIQLPQVSKEHCRIELNENKEVILTNLSSVNPTLINGKPIQQSERLKHGDIITIIDRCFRFECPPEPTPKKNIPPAKRKSETLQVLQEHQVREADASVSGEKGKYPQTPEQTCLKDGTNMVLASVGDSDEAVGKQAFVTSLDQSISTAKEVLSPFSELYEMTKQSLSEKLPRKSEQPKTPCSRRDSKMEVVPRNASLDKPASASGADVTPKSGRSMTITPGREDLQSPTQKLQDAIEQVVTPVQVTPKVRRSMKSPAKQLTAAVSEDQLTPVSQKKNHISTPQKFTAAEVAQHVLSQGTSVLEDCTISKSVTPKTRRSKEAHSPAGGEGGPRSPGRPFVCTPNQAKKTNGQSVEVKEKSPRATVVSSKRTSPRTTAGKLQALSVLETAAPSCGENEGGQSGRHKKRKSGDLGDLPVPLMKRKRVSFGGQLSPELFDKRLPPNSPLRKGATPGRRSLSVLKKHPVLRRASVIGLIQELPSEKSSSEKPKASSPRMRASSKAGSTSRTPSPAKKTPAAKSKTPSPGKTKSPKVKPGMPSKEKEKSPSRRSSKTVDQSPSRRRSPSKENPLTSKGLKSPAFQPQTPVSVLGKTTTPRRRESSSAGSKCSPKTTSPEGESLSAEISINDASASQTPIVRGRFSISRIETPSPVADQDTAAPESFASNSSVSITPSVLLRRVSLKSAKATPRSARRSALELMRLRRSGASQANLKVVSSWADIVKFGTTKAQTEITSKKRISRRKAVRTMKQKPKPPKTPIQKLKGHFSTGHAESPATIVVGKAHAKTVLPTGCAPNFVRNTALTKESMNMNEDLTGIAEIFSTPMNTRQKRANCGKSHSPKTSQDVPLSEASVMNTPEETGEMVVSPLSADSTVKRGCYNSEAVVRLLTDDQECSFTCSDSVQQKATSDVISSEHTEQRDLVLERMVVTPKQKPEPEMPLTGVKRLMKTPKQKAMQKEDLTGIKRLLKTPKQPKVSEEVSLIGVKELLKTPKVKGQPIDIVGVQRITPKVKAEPQVFTTGVKQLMRTAKRKNEPVDDMVGLKRLMRTPKQTNKPVEGSFGVKQLLQTPKQKNEPVQDMVGLKRIMRTPKQKNEPVEDMVGLKRIMRTPKQKNEPVEDMVGLKRLMRTPKQKNEPVEDMVGLKRLMRTPKQKGKPVENKFGIAKLMKSPKIRGTIAIEDYTGLQELMQEPEVPVARIISKCHISEHVCTNPCPSMNGEIFTSAEAKVAFEEPLELPGSQSKTSKKAVRRCKKNDIPAEDKSADSKRDPAIRAAEPNISEVKSKRGRQTRRGLPSTLGEEALTPAVATPVKTTRGRRAKPVPGAAEDKVTVAEEPASPIVKPRRGRPAKTLVKEAKQPSPVVLPAKRMCRGGPTATAMTASSVHSPRPGRGRKMLDTREALQEEKLIQPDASSTKVGMKSIRNTRGSRKNNPIAGAGTASVCVAAPLPSKLESTVPPNESPGLDNLVIENEKSTTRRGKAAPQGSKANKADKKSAVEQTVAIKAAVKRVVSKTTAKWDLEIPDSQDVTELPGSKKRSGVAGREIVDMSAEKTTEPSTKPRRGRGAKKPSTVCSEPTVSDQIRPAQSTTPLKSSKGKEPAAKDVIAPKRGAKRKVARDEPVEHLEEASAESPSRLSTTKRVRGKAARLEENRPATSPVRRQRGPAKKAVKTTEKLEGSQKVETPKPVGRSRRRVVQRMEAEPVSNEREPGRGNASVTEPSDGGKVKSAARGRRKSPAKPEAPSVTEARPVRRTRRK